MKKLSATLLTSICLITLFSALIRPSASPVIPLIKSCGCSADDGSCSISITCTGGCQEFCGNDGDCYAECGGFYQALAIETNLEMQNAKYPQLVTALARVSGKDLAFSPNKPDALFNLGFKRAAVWDALELLSDRGTVHFAGRDFEKLKRLRKILLSGEKISFGVKDTPVNTFVNDLAGLTGLPLRIASGRPMALANVELKDATLNDIILRVSEQTGTKIIEESADRASR